MKCPLACFCMRLVSYSTSATTARWLFYEGMESQGWCWFCSEQQFSTALMAKTCNIHATLCLHVCPRAPGRQGEPVHAGMAGLKFSIHNSLWRLQLWEHSKCLFCIKLAVVFQFFNLWISSGLFIKLLGWIFCYCIRKFGCVFSLVDCDVPKSRDWHRNTPAETIFKMQNPKCKGGKVFLGQEALRNRKVNQKAYEDKIS